MKLSVALAAIFVGLFVCASSAYEDPLSPPGLIPRRSLRRSSRDGGPSDDHSGNSRGKRGDDVDDDDDSKGKGKGKGKGDSKGDDDDDDDSKGKGKGKGGSKGDDDEPDATDRSKDDGSYGSHRFRARLRLPERFRARKRHLITEHHRAPDPDPRAVKSTDSSMNQRVSPDSHKVASTMALDSSPATGALAVKEVFLDDRHVRHLSNRSGFKIVPNFHGSIKSAKQTFISIGTQMNVGPTRLQRLLDIANRWDGYISVTVYTKVDEIELLSDLTSFCNDNAPILKDKVVVHLVVDERSNDGLFYPHNILRNIAMEYTPTKHVLNLDIDFIPSVDSHSQLMKHLSSIQSRPSQQPYVVVVPAFERGLSENENEATITAKDLPPSKLDLLGEMLSDRHFFAPFHQSYAPGHGPTNYSMWYTASESYQVDFALNYEPYYVVTKSKRVPPFWEHFSGYGKNKQTWVEEMGIAGFEFHVVPDAFIIHVNHNNEEQDERIVRPSMIEEYAFNFQNYLLEAYGMNLWSEEDISQWVEMNKRKYSLKDTHFCKSSTLEFNSGNPFRLEFQCSGWKYKKFGKALLKYAAENIAAPMGRRPFPFPSNSTVLFFGNSHTRQVSKALLCQYSETVVSFEDKSVGTTNAEFFVARLSNNSTLISLTNNPVVYSKDWASLIEDIIHRPLASLDAIVLGKFNSYKESKGTRFIQTVADVAKNMKVTVDFENNPAPRLKNVARIFEAPIIGVSMFGTKGRPEHEANAKTRALAEQKHNRTNLSIIDGRKHIEFLGYECGSDNKSGEGQCHEPGDKDKDSYRSAEEMHRCVGNSGGHPDLIAWEVIESIYSSLP